MSKRKIAYVCTDCGSEHSKWQGQCSDCKQWNTLKEFVVSAAKPSARNQASTGYAKAASAQNIQRLADVDLTEMPRIKSGMLEFDREIGRASCRERV